MTPNSARVSEAGLSLIEVMIAMAVLAFLSIAIYQATSRSFDINFRISAEANEYTAIALSLQALETDLSQIFSPTIDLKTPLPSDPGNPSPFWSVPLRPDGIRRARFKGSSDKMTFITNNNRRTHEGSPQSDFLAVSWELSRNDGGTYSLSRTMDWDAFNYEDTKQPKAVPLLENITSAKFQFYRKENRTWEDQWDSESAFAKPEERYPSLIKVKLEIPDPSNSSAQQKWDLTAKMNLPINGPPKGDDRELIER